MSVSAEDLEKYETEMELQLYREYRDVVGLFPTSSRPSAASTWPTRSTCRCASRRRRGLLRADDARRLGVGHVPPGPVREERAGRDVQGRQHRGARQAPTWSCPRRAASGLTVHSPPRLRPTSTPGSAVSSAVPAAARLRRGGGVHAGQGRVGIDGERVAERFLLESGLVVLDRTGDASWVRSTSSPGRRLPGGL